MITRVAPVTTWFDRLAADVLGPSVMPAAPQRGPRTAARSTDDGLELRVELPGIAEEDIDIAIDGRVLSVTAARTEGGERWTTGRKVTVGEGYDLDAARAHYRHGLLTIVVPPARPATRRVAITPAPVPAQAVEATTTDTPAADTTAAEAPAAEA